MGNLFQAALVEPILNGLLVIYHLLFAVHVPYPLGFAIIVLTVVIRLVLYPFTHQQLKASHKMQKLSPHLSRLKEQHKGDAKRLQQETMKLYKEHGVNPAAGCLPMLIQLPIIWGLYGVLNQVVKYNPHEIVAKINHVAYSKSLGLTSPWNTYFFGMPLGQTPNYLFSHGLYLILLVPILTGFFQFIQSKMMVPPKQPKEQKTKNSSDDFATMFQTQSLYLFPLMIAFFSFNFPIGLSLYWNTFTIFGILQQWQVKRVVREIAPVSTAPAKKKRK